MVDPQVGIHYTRTLASRGEFPELLNAFRALGGIGANVTVPLKELAWELATTRSPQAELAGAVNTLVRTEQGWHGENTDGIGLYVDLCDLHVALKDADILLVGAGGAARGVIPALLAAEPRTLVIANRTLERAKRLADVWQSERANPRQIPVSASSFSDLAQNETPWAVIINATSSGLQGERPPLPNAILEHRPFCYDMVYGAAPTPFLQWASEQQCPIADGLGMLVGQAAESFYLWTGFRPDRATVLHDLRASIRANEKDAQ